ncbi:hypothetical protein [Streptomyces xylophagus]|uniref:hypothetical protein n=1 Tax=Streptomyces xylophagus TaxID=285514 RepID=UPI0005B82C2A|nr:hypothetical protein [Streptomyces xylophagus]
MGRGRGAVPAVVRAGVRISVGELEPADAARLASGFAAVLGEGKSEAAYREGDQARLRARSS